VHPNAWPDGALHLVVFGNNLSQPDSL